MEGTNFTSIAPRTFAQLNLELRDALLKLGEQGPFVLVGRSFGGPVVRNFAAEYRSAAAGMVLVDAAFEGQRLGVGGKATMRLGDDAKGRDIPSPHEEIKDSDQWAFQSPDATSAGQPLHSMYAVLPEAERRLQLWAQNLPGIDEVESEQRGWSAEYFAKWLNTPQAGKLGSIPLIVLTRTEGGYERQAGQARLALLSTNSKQIVIRSGHNAVFPIDGEKMVILSVDDELIGLAEALQLFSKLQWLNWINLLVGASVHDE